MYNPCVKQNAHIYYFNMTAEDIFHFSWKKKTAFQIAYKRI